MNRIQKQFIKDALQYDHKLSEWEFNFINDLAEKDDNYELTDKQNAVLNRISQKLED